MWLLLLALGCAAPMPTPVATLDAAPEAPPRADAAQQGVFDTLEKTLAEQEANTGIAAYGQGAKLARTLEEGVSDPEVRAASMALLHWLATTDLRPPAAPDTGVDPHGARADERATAETADTRIDQAREALRRGDYRAAIETLRPLKDGPGWEDAQPYWTEAVDGWVYQERERAGKLFVDAQRMQGKQRHDKLLEVQRILSGLIDDYPDSAYAQPLQDNLERVERALETEPAVP